MRRDARTQAPVGAHDADVVPHEAAQLVPVVGDDDRLVAGRGLRRGPSRARRAAAQSSGCCGERARGAVAEHQPLEQRVGGEAVGAVQAGAGDLADRPQAGQAGAAVAIDHHAAAHVVRRGHHRDGLAGEVDAERLGARVDVGEALAQEVGRLVRSCRATRSRRRVRFISKSMARATTSRGARSFMRVVALHEGGAVGAAAARRPRRAAPR